MQMRTYFSLRNRFTDPRRFRARVSYEIGVAYEKLPKHCSHCHLAGHIVLDCGDTRRQAESVIPPESRDIDHSQAHSTDVHQGHSRDPHCLYGNSLVV
ncbi:hypothetical protein LguiB_006258 [Lonicera macranthoides]